MCPAQLAECARQAAQSSGGAEGDILADEVRAGLFDNTEIALSFVNWQDPDGHGEIRLRRGTLGEVRLTPQGHFTAELRGLA